MADIGINCRNTAGFVTDGAAETYWLGEAYPTIRGGVTFGGEDSSGVGAGFLSVNSSGSGSSYDRRLAGCCYRGSGHIGHSLRVDLPSTGNYDVHVAAGWDNTSFGNFALWDLLDGSTVFASLNDTGSLLQDFIDATSARLSAANWPGNEQAVNRSFASTIFRVKMRSNPPSNSNVLAHVRLVSVAAGATVEESVSFALGSSIAQSAGAIVGEAVGLGLGAGVSNVGPVTANASLALALASSVAQSATVIVGEALSLAINAAALVAGGASVEAAVALALSSGISSTTGNITVETIALEAAAGLSVEAQASVAESVAMAIAASISSSATAIASGSVSMPVASGLSNVPTATVEASIVAAVASALAYLATDSSIAVPDLIRFVAEALKCQQLTGERLTFSRLTNEDLR